MSMFNDIIWRNKLNEPICLENSASVSEYEKSSPKDVGHFSGLVQK